MGVVSYEHSVGNGSNVFFGSKGHKVIVSHPQKILTVSPHPSKDALLQALAVHQKGQTDYPTFCLQAAQAGVEKWVSDLTLMTISYLDSSGKRMLVEKIPS